MVLLSKDITLFMYTPLKLQNVKFRTWNDSIYNTCKETFPISCDSWQNQKT